MMKLTIYGDPRTKKNSSRVIRNNGKTRVLPSRQFSDYELCCLRQINGNYRNNINYPINLKVTYYMRTRRKCDLVNLLQGTCDMLVKADVLEDDNFTIIATMDGSEVKFDKLNPRIEIEITKKE